MLERRDRRRRSALTADTFIYTDPVFSPDGTRLAYVSTQPNGFFNVFVRPIRNGRWAGDEVQITTDNRYPRNRLYFGSRDMHIEPAWMRDGKNLLLVSNRGVPLGSGNVWKVPLEADAMAKAKPVLMEQSLFRPRPDVSIDGKRFIYSSHRGAADQYDNLYVLPVEGGEPYKLTCSTTTRSIRAGRLTASRSPTSRTKAACRAGGARNLRRRAQERRHRPAALEAAVGRRVDSHRRCGGRAG